MNVRSRNREGGKHLATLAEESLKLLGTQSPERERVSSSNVDLRDEMTTTTGRWGDPGEHNGAL